VRKRSRKEVLKNQRRELNHYFIASTVYYIFSIILSICLIPISLAIKDQNSEEKRLTNHILFMVFLFLLGVGSLMYLVKRIHWLLVEIEEELRFNASRKDADEVFRDVDRPSDLNTT
jgi:uncharacterized membrane protein